MVEDVKNDASASFLDHLHGEVELIAAVATVRTERVARETLGMGPDKNRLAFSDIPFDEGDVVFVVDDVLKDENLEVAVFRGERGLVDLIDEAFVLHPEFDQVGDG
jgi:hypothetical protein